MAKNKRAPARHKAEDDYILTTKLFCGKCRAMMFGECGTNRVGNIYHYYKCNAAKRHLGCDKKAVNKVWIEDIVVRSVHKMLSDEELITQWTKKILEIVNREDNALVLLQKELSDTKRGIDNMLNAIQNGIFTESTQQRLTDLEKCQKKLASEIEVESFQHVQLTPDHMKCWFSRMAKLDIKKKEHRERLIDTFINAVFLYDDRIVITFNYKNGTKSINLAELNCSDLVGSTRPTI